jgi:hypothetical protein
MHNVDLEARGPAPVFGSEKGDRRNKRRVVFPQSKQAKQAAEAAVGGGDQNTKIRCSEVFGVAGCPRVT